DLLVERFDVGEVDHGGFQGFAKICPGQILQQMLGHKDLERPVGLLDGPAECLPQADKKIDLEKDQRVGRIAVGVTEDRLVEITLCVWIGENEDLVEVTILPGCVKPRFGLEPGRLEHCSQSIEALFKSRLFFSGERLILWMFLVSEDIAYIHLKFSEDDKRVELGIDETGAHQIDKFFVTDPQSPGKRFGRVEIGTLARVLAYRTG